MRSGPNTAAAYFGLNPDIPGDVPEIFARATRKERIAVRPCPPPLQRCAWLRAAQRRRACAHGVSRRLSLSRKQKLKSWLSNGQSAEKDFKM